VLTAGVTAKSNKARASLKAAIHTAVIIAPMLARLLQASANVDTPAAARVIRDGGQTAIPIFCKTITHSIAVIAVVLWIAYLYTFGFVAIRFSINRQQMRHFLF
jgi:hypothetical protein